MRHVYNVAGKASIPQPYGGKNGPELKVATLNSAEFAVEQELRKFVEDIIRIYRSKIKNTIPKLVGSLVNVGRVYHIGSDAIEGYTVAYVDGGSGVLPLNAGYIGLAAAVGIVVEKGRITSRIVKTSIVKGVFDFEGQLTPVLSKLREGMVLEVASEIAEKTDVDMIIVDGPITPHGLPARLVTGSKEEAEALNYYLSNAKRLYEAAVKRGKCLVGFIKRPRSRFLAIALAERYKSVKLPPRFQYDHLLLALLLQEPCTFAPNPPLAVPAVESVFPVEQARRIVESYRPSYTFIRLDSTAPPYRVELCCDYVVGGYERILSYLCSQRSTLGIPALILKVDSEAKITSETLEAMYRDLLSHIIQNIVSQDNTFFSSFDDILPILPEFGGEPA